MQSPGSGEQSARNIDKEIVREGKLLRKPRGAEGSIERMEADEAKNF